MTYHIYCGIDFEHCERGKCENCDEEQRVSCEWEANHPVREGSGHKRELKRRDGNEMD